MKKNLVKMFLTFAAGCLTFFVACKKENSISEPKAFLTASNMDAKVGEAVLLTVANLPIGASVEWASTPATNASITRTSFTGDVANAVFKTAGTYTITAYVQRGNHHGDTTHHDTTHHGHHGDSTWHDSTHNGHHGDTTHHDTTHHGHHGDSTWHDSTHNGHHGDTTHHDTTHHGHHGDSTWQDSTAGSPIGTDYFLQKISITITVH